MGPHNHGPYALFYKRSKVQGSRRWAPRSPWNKAPNRNDKPTTRRRIELDGMVLKS
ncbi:unnamed protein product, partial [Vitis vinifera]